MSEVISRAQGCMLGQFAGDSLGSLVEFQTPEEIQRQYPEGVRKLADGGTWNTLAGQPTDDSEMALMLARTLLARKTYDAEAIRKAYVYWLDSDPFDCGSTVANGLRGHAIRASEANGAMMRVSPLGIFGANYADEQVAEWAKQDAALTHPNPVCVDANALYTTAIASAVRRKVGPQELVSRIAGWAEKMRASEVLQRCIDAAATAPPRDYVRQQGWVVIAFHNALWQLLHAASLEEGVVDTVMRGGDTDTNAAIAGALLGAVYGRDAVPAQWAEAVLNCRPDAGAARPRPKCFWPVDAQEVAEGLVAIG